MSKSASIKRVAALASFTAGAIAGAVLLALGAPFWAYYLAPVAALPLLLAYLEVHGKPRPREIEMIFEKPHLQVSKGPTPNFVRFGEVLPEDPYIWLRTPSSVYVVSRPDDRVPLRMNTVQRRGMEAAFVTQRRGRMAVRRDPPDLLSAIYGTDVLTGSSGSTRRNSSSPLNLRGPQAAPIAAAINVGALQLAVAR